METLFAIRKVQEAKKAVADKVTAPFAEVDPEDFGPVRPKRNVRSLVSQLVVV